jgi:hypothetical protein
VPNIQVKTYDLVNKVFRRIVGIVRTRWKEESNGHKIMRHGHDLCPHGAVHHPHGHDHLRKKMNITNGGQACLLTSVWYSATSPSTSDTTSCTPPRISCSVLFVFNNIKEIIWYSKILYLARAKVHSFSLYLCLQKIDI